MTADSDLDRVIRAINGLRSMKYRPNQSNVVKLMKKKYGFSSIKTINLLKKLNSQNKEEEVLFRGNFSYRTTYNRRQAQKVDLSIKINRSLVIATMLRLMSEDRKSEALEGDKVNGGVEGTRLESSLVEEVGGTGALKVIRKQIKVELTKGTLKKTPAGLYILAERYRKKSPNIDLDMDLLESCETQAPLNLDSTNEETAMDSSVNSSVVSLTKNTHKPIKSCKTYFGFLKNLELSIERVVQDGHDSKDDDMTESEKEVCEKIERPEITCRSPDKSSTDAPDNKRRRVIRKKTIFDPSEFESTPVPRKNRSRNSNTVASAVVRERKSKTRRNAPTNVTWTMSKDPESSVDCNDVQEQSSDNSLLESPKEKLRTRGRPPANVNKKCSVCLSSAEKSLPSILSCSLCLNIAHKNCVKDDSFYKGSKKWRCEDCKVYNPVVCSACELESTKKQALLMCDFCEEFFHPNCHYPSVELPLLESTWRCSSCPILDKNERIKIKNEDDCNEKVNNELELNVKSSSLPFVSDKATSPPPFNTLRLSDKDIKSEENSEKENDASSEQVFIFPITFKMSNCVRHKPDETIPSVDDWTVQQVSDYFLDKFGQDVADAFYAQEIDGKLLKQISRQYVTNDLGLQLGIALKVLYYVRKIQLGTNLLQQLWA